MSIQTLEAQLKKIDRQRARLTRQLEIRKTRQFTLLPTKVGLRNVDELILSLAPYASPKLRARLPGNSGQPMSAAPAVSAGRRAAHGRPARYSEDVRASARKLLEQGELTGAEIGRKLGVSRFTIKDWKKGWGLAKKRRRAPKKK